MKSYQNQPRYEDNQKTEFESVFGRSMLDSDKKVQIKQPLISFQYHPGFLCFFQDYIKSQNWLYSECFQKVFKSHQEMMKIRKPVQQIFKIPQSENVEIINDLILRAQKGINYAYYKPKLSGQLQCKLVINEDKRMEQIQKLKKQLQKLQKIKMNVIQRKKKQFQNKQIQRSKQLQIEALNVMSEKQRRAYLVQKIQSQAQQKRNQRPKGSTESLSTRTSQQFSSCQIM